MNIIDFHKMHGCGNDFVIIDNRLYDLKFNSDYIKFIASRSTGVGCDQVIIIEDSSRADFMIRIYNNDGGSAGTCGNALRCITKLFGPQGKTIKIETAGGVVHSEYGKLITVNMGKPKLKANDIPVESNNPQNVDIMGMNGFCLNMGNPHIVFFVGNFDFDVEMIGKSIENNLIFPEKINVNFARIISEGEIALRVWERGAGETLACGSGACASFYTAYHKGLVKSEAIVSQTGGNLTISVRDRKIYMSGDATYVYKGSINYFA